jgi:pimeloyl-ACP methyl ester carboxylesterase
MHVVFLPGLDGTGELFLPLLEVSTFEKVSVIKLPILGRQDYDSLAQYVSERLPTEDFLLVAESFSGPVAAIIAQKGFPSLKGVVFVSTFLSTPPLAVTPLIAFLPFKLFASLPFFGYFLRQFLVGKGTKKNTVSLIKQVIHSIPSRLLRARIRCISKMNLRLSSCFIPALYIQASKDFLVPEYMVDEYFKHFSKLKMRRVQGHHFLLQSHPSEARDLILEFIDQVQIEN